MKAIESAGRQANREPQGGGCPADRDSRTAGGVDARSTAEAAAPADSTAWEIATAGTYVDRGAPRALLVAVLLVALAMVAIPSAGMLWARTDATTENRVLADPPQLFDEQGAFNWNVLADAGAYFDDHFAYRNYLVAANARLRAAVSTSPTDQVVVGGDGWLYYGGTLPDYLGQSEMTERGLRNIAHNLKLVQSYAAAHDATFVFAIAPNKNSLYPAHMPYYYLPSTAPGNAERLEPLLDEEGVRYVDLFDVLGGQEGEWYLLHDSHWDNRGALMGTQELLAAVGHDALDLQVGDGEARDDFVGDLETMLYPAGATTEANWYYEGVNDGDGMAGSRWAYEEGRSVTDAFVRTSSPDGTGSLLMFRDSFGNALVPYWATAYAKATFSKLVPYNVPAMLDAAADTVVIERAERHIAYLATDPPIMPAPAMASDPSWPAEARDGQGEATVRAMEDGGYWKVTGILPEGCASPDSDIYLALETSDGESVTFVPMWRTFADSADDAGEPGESEGSDATAPSTTDADSDSAGASGWMDYGFQAHISRERFDLASCVLRVYVGNGGAVECVGVFPGSELAQI